MWSVSSLTLPRPPSRPWRKRPGNSFFARRRDRKPRPSDYVDLLNLETLAIADYVTTEKDMKSTYLGGGPLDTRGRLFARGELEVMLDQVQRQLSETL